jgi:hypothetical protein
VDLLVTQLKAAIRRVLETKGVRARVLDKVNRYGEVVIGVILERPAASPLAGAQGTDRGAERGSENENVEPRPASLTTPIEPPCAETSSREIHSPRPRPE